MLIQVSTPRPLFDPSKHPLYIHIHTLRKAGVSKGEVFFSATVDPEHGTKQSKSLDPVNEYPIEGQDGVAACEYVLPFWQLFKRTQKMLNAKYNGQSALSQGIRVGDVGMSRFAASGFQVTAKSAFRADSYTYAEHIVAFTVMTPTTGGGILRLANTTFDLANPTFDPWAEGPAVPKDPALQLAYDRTHKALPAGSRLLRTARIVEAEANKRQNETKALNAPEEEGFLEEPEKPKGLLEQAKKLLGGG